MRKHAELEFVTYRVLDVYPHNLLDSLGASGSYSDEPDEES